MRGYFTEEEWRALTTAVVLATVWVALVCLVRLANYLASP